MSLCYDVCVKWLVTKETDGLMWHELLRTFSLRSSISFFVAVFVLLYLIYGFSSNNERQAFARRTQYLAARYRWPNATIPYVIDCSIANVYGAKRIIKTAMAAWENRTCIRFVKRTNQQNYLLIRRQKGCWGQVGFGRGARVLSMGDGCEYNYVMMHELGHVIGFYHEHQRADRDEFIEILWDNIMNSMLKQFYKRPEKDHMDTELPYDYSSIMHYKFTAFTMNYSMSTIVVRDKNSTVKHTPYSFITDLDVRKTEEMYNCPKVESNPKNKTGENTNEDMRQKLRQGKNETPEMEIVEAVEVSLMSPGWLVTDNRERIASIMVNGREMAKNRQGMNLVVFNYLSAKRTHSVSLSITNKWSARRFANYLKTKTKRNYFLIVSKVPSLQHLQEARLALKDVGIRLPRYIPYGSSICIVGYKGKEDVAVKYVIGTPRQKASFLSMNITLPSYYSCQNDAPRCTSKAKEGLCQRRPDYYMKACQKSCGTCMKEKPCIDENPKCEVWAKKRDSCRTHPSYMLKYCKVSCRICRKALPAQIIAKGDSSPRKRKIVVVDDAKKRVKETLLKDDDPEDEYDGRAIGTRCKDESQTCSAWASAGRCQTDSWVKRHCLLSCKIKGSCDREQIKPEGVCSEPFGVGWDRKIPDSRFTASTFYKTGEWNASAYNARLYMEDDFKAFRIGAWCSEYPARQGEWLKIDLGRTRTITAVATQGRFRYYEHVKTYKLSFSKNDKTWKYYLENGRDKEFKGNCDHVSPVLNILEQSVFARYVRFHPIKFYEGICMRVEIFGC